MPKIDPELVAKGEQCGTCGLRQAQLEPMWRFVNRETGAMMCNHSLSAEQIDAIPDWMEPK